MLTGRIWRGVLLPWGGIWGGAVASHEPLSRARGVLGCHLSAALAVLIHAEWMGRGEVTVPPLHGSPLLRILWRYMPIGLSLTAIGSSHANGSSGLCRHPDLVICNRRLDQPFLVSHRPRLCRLCRLVPAVVATYAGCTASAALVT